MNQRFKELCTLIDEFWQGYAYTKPGPKPALFDDFYLKLTFYGILSKTVDKGRWLERGERDYPYLFKKTFPKRTSTTIVKC